MDRQSQHSSNLDFEPQAHDAVASLPLGGRIKRFSQAVLACVWPIRSGYDVVRVIVAVVLLVAAGLKCHQLATEPILEKTWLAALGCFSTVHVNPWYTSTLDFCIVVSLLIWRPRLLPSPASGRGTEGEGGCHPVLPSGFLSRAFIILLAWLVIGLPVAYAMGRYATILSNVGTIVGDGKIVVLEPEKWGDKRFPLLPYIEDAPDQTQADERPLRERLTEGKWLVMLYHHDCPKCQTAVQDLPKAAQTAGVQQIALIAMPPDGIQDEVASRLQNSMKGCLDSNRNWLAETPIIVMIQDAKISGVVVQQ